MNPDNSSEKKVKMPETDDEQRKLFPGYPPYPAFEDFMSISNPSKRIDADVENFTPAERLGNASGAPMHNQDPLQGYLIDKSENENGEDPDLKFVAGNDADVTKEDIENLGDPDQDLDDGDDENIARALPDPREGEEDELDVPGADLDDDMEEIGSEDEENNYYSLGSDNNDDESDDPSTNVEDRA